MHNLSIGQGLTLSPMENYQVSFKYFEHCILTIVLVMPKILPQKLIFLMFFEIFQDKRNPDVTTKQFQNIPFNAELADDNSNYAMITTMNGVDGFVMDVDPLYKVCFLKQSGPEIIKLFFMLSTTEHEISTTYKVKC